MGKTIKNTSPHKDIKYYEVMYYVLFSDPKPCMVRAILGTTSKEKANELVRKRIAKVFKIDKEELDYRLILDYLDEYKEDSSYD